jgi:hypothetical protein
MHCFKGWLYWLLTFQIACFYTYEPYFFYNFLIRVLKSHKNLICELTLFHFSYYFYKIKIVDL